MKPIKEPQDVDFVIQSNQWSEKDLTDFRKMMFQIKTKKIGKRASLRERIAIS